MTAAQLKLKHIYLNKHIFYGLKKNPDVETSSMVTFDEADFSIVLERVHSNRIGIYGIEVSLDGQYYGIKTHEEYSTFPQDQEWITAAFEYFKSLNLNLRYSASYYVGGNLFN